MLQDTGHVIKAQERVDAYYSGKEQIVATLMQIANHLHNPPPTERKAPEQIIAPDITKLKQAHMKLREMSDILVQAIALVCAHSQPKGRANPSMSTRQDPITGGMSGGPLLAINLIAPPKTPLASL